MGGGGKTTTTVENKDPWAPSQPYLLKGFSEASSIYDQNKANNDRWTGDFYAEARPEQYDALSGAINFANGPGTEAAYKAINAGGTLTDQGIAGMGQAGQGLSAFANSNMTAANNAAAAQYADNPYISGMVDSAMMDSRRQAAEEIRPQIDRNAAATGNMNSTRKAISEGIVDRGLAEKAAGISADLRGQAYQQGQTLAQADADRRLSALTGAGSLASDAAKTGLYGLSSGLDMQKSNIDTAINAGTMLNAADQTALDNALAKFEYSKQEPWDNLNNYYGIISDGGRQGGTTTSVSKVKEKPSALSTAGSIMGMAAAFLCDERAKENIKEIGTRPSGIKEYEFNYRGETEKHIGPIAQQVAKIVPDAVFEQDGLLHVSVAKLREHEQKSRGRDRG